MVCTLFTGTNGAQAGLAKLQRRAGVYHESYSPVGAHCVDSGEPFIFETVIFFVLLLVLVFHSNFGFQTRCSSHSQRFSRFPCSWLLARFSSLRCRGVGPIRFNAPRARHREVKITSCEFACMQALVGTSVSFYFVDFNGSGPLHLQTNT